MGTGKNIVANYAIFFLMLLLIISCSGQKQTSSVNPKGTPAKVIDYRELDGCEFLLELGDGTKLQPVNLDSQFKKDKLEVLITWKKYDGVSICMAGEMIELTSITLATNHK